MASGDTLHVVMFPWLAMGHLIPFMHLSKCLAQKGPKVSFISAPRNIDRLPKIPLHLSPLISLVRLPLPHVDGLPDHVESSTDVSFHKQQLLRRAFDFLSSQVATFLEASRPDWIVYDFASHWLPQLAARLGVSRPYFCIFNAACMSFISPPEALIDGGSRLAAEDFTVVPNWIPFHSNVVHRLHEIAKNAESLRENESGTPDTVRIAFAVAESDLVATRTSAEFERHWLNLLVELYPKPTVPIGFLHPELTDGEAADDEKWVYIKEWLDKQKFNSVVYVALGTEATLSPHEVNELALGLEQSGLAFFWVQRYSSESTQTKFPTGFAERVKGRGIVHVGWAPQAKILSHNSIGGFLTHCGWNSVIEGLGFGRVLILFPCMNDQGLNARLLHGKRLGVEIPRNERDGSFTHLSVAESVRLAMVDNSGESLRAMAKEMKGLIGDKDKNDHLVDGFIRLLQEKRSTTRN